MVAYGKKTGFYRGPDRHLFQSIWFKFAMVYVTITDAKFGVFACTLIGADVPSFFFDACECAVQGK